MILICLVRGSMHFLPLDFMNNKALVPKFSAAGLFQLKIIIKVITQYCTAHPVLGIITCNKI